MTPDLIDRMEAWKHGHKARSVTIHIGNGYGSTSWVAELEGNGPTIEVIESVDCGQVDPSDGAVAGFPFIKATDGSLSFDINGPKRGEWAGLRATLEAALKIAEELKL